MSPEHLQQVKDQAVLLHDKSAVELALERLSVQLHQDYSGKDPIFLVVMNGALLFAGKLLGKLDFPAQIDYCHATRYRGELTGADIHWKVEPNLDLTNRHVVVVDDILDEGHTLQAILDFCRARNAASVKSLMLIEKIHERKAVKGMRPDYCELQSPDEYVFGMGMDYNHYWRNTESIYYLANP